MFGSKSVTIDPANIFINANLTSGGTLDLTATDAIDIAKAVTVRSLTSTGAGSGDMTLDATTIKADPTSLIVAGASAGPPTSKVSVNADRGEPDAGDPPGHERLDRPQGPEGCAQRASGRQCNACRAGSGHSRVSPFSTTSGAHQPPGSTVSAGNDFIDANVTSGGAIDVKAFADVDIAAGVNGALRLPPAPGAGT